MKKQDYKIKQDYKKRQDYRIRMDWNRWIKPRKQFQLLKLYDAFLISCVLNSSFHIIL